MTNKSIYRPVYKTTSKLERYLTSIHGTSLLLDKLDRGEIQIFYVSTEIPYHIVQKQLKDYTELIKNNNIAIVVGQQGKNKID